MDTAPQASGQLVFPGQWLGLSDNGTHGFYGSAAAGHVAVGDKVRATASGHVATVQRIVGQNGCNLSSATLGQRVTLLLDNAPANAHSDVLAYAAQPIEMTDRFEAELHWASNDVLGLRGQTYGIRLAGQHASATIAAIQYRLNASPLDHEDCQQLEFGSTAVCELALTQALAFDRHQHSPVLGSFTLVDPCTEATVASGSIRHNLRRAQNVHHQLLSIARQDRERLNGHRGKVIWFTGLSGSGKSTIANALELELHAQGRHTYILDGDNVRQGLNKDLGFSDADRIENIRRIAEVAKLMMDAGLIVMTAFISPFRCERDMARRLIGTGNFVEVYVDTPLEVCEQRDPKGLYRKARSGLIPNMTGINSPYEAPEHPELRYAADSSLQELLRWV